MKVIKSKYLFGAIFLTLALIFSTTYVYSADFQIQMNSNKTEIQPGETIDIQVALDNFEGKTIGSNVFMATLEYDKNVFEKLKEENIEALNEWTGFSYNEENGKMIMNKMNKVEKNEAILKIHFTVKKDIENTNTTIKILDAKSAGDSKQLNADTGQIEIKIEKNNTVISIIIPIVLFIIGEIIAYVVIKLNIKKKGEN